MNKTIGIGVVLAGVALLGYSGWLYSQNCLPKVEVGFVDTSEVFEATAGQFYRTPVKVVNRSGVPARIIGSNAC